MEIRLSVPHEGYLVRRRVNVSMETCPICEGECEITVKGSRFKCPQCEGQGFQRKLIEKWSVEPKALLVVRAGVDVKSGEIDYRLESEDGTLIGTSEKFFFASYEDAVKDVERRNAG